MRQTKKQKSKKTPPAPPITAESLKAKQAAAIAAKQAAAKDLVDNFTTYDKQIHDGGGVIVNTIDQMLPVIEQMRGLISRKGDPAFIDLRRMAKLPKGSKYETIPAFGDYLRDICDEFGLSLRTIQRKLAELRGEDEEDEEDKEEKPSYKPPTRREFLRFAQLAEGVNITLDEYDHPGDEPFDVAEHIEKLRKLEVPAKQVSEALTNGSTLEKTEQLVIPVIATSSAYIIALENALAHPGYSQYLVGIEGLKDGYRVACDDAKVRQLFKAAGAKAPKVEKPKRYTVQVDEDGVKYNLWDDGTKTYDAGQDEPVEEQPPTDNVTESRRHVHARTEAQMRAARVAQGLNPDKPLRASGAPTADELTTAEQSTEKEGS